MAVITKSRCILYAVGYNAEADHLCDKKKLQTQLQSNAFIRYAYFPSMIGGKSQVPLSLSNNGPKDENL